MLEKRLKSYHKIVFKKTTKPLIKGLKPRLLMSSMPKCIEGGGGGQASLNNAYVINWWLFLTKFCCNSPYLRYNDLILLKGLVAMQNEIKQLSCLSCKMILILSFCIAFK